MKIACRFRATFKVEKNEKKCRIKLFLLAFNSKKSIIIIIE